MKRILFLFLLCAAVCSMSAHGGTVKGKVFNKQTTEPLSFVSVKVERQSDGKFVAGALTDDGGAFAVTSLSDGDYVLTLSFVGYKSLTRSFTISADKRTAAFSRLYMSEDAHVLDGVTVTGQASGMKLEVDRKSFDVTQLISNSGEAASDVLDNIPSVEVDNDGNISLRGDTSVEVWINGKSSGLTSDNRAQILQQLPAESIERIEVIDNPSAKFSAEGSAGIINIVLKKDRRAGYYGSLQAGGDVRKGANTSFNINYSSSLFDAYLNLGYRHRANTGHSTSDQVYTSTNEYQRYGGGSDDRGNNLFARAGLTWHIADADEVAFNGMMMIGGRNEGSDLLYHYGTVGGATDSYAMLRETRSDDSSKMFYGELTYRHTFGEKHFVDLTLDANRWTNDNANVYRDSTEYYQDDIATTYDYQLVPIRIQNRRWEVKAEYENRVTDHFKIEAGYQGTFSSENTPQQSFYDESRWDGSNAVEDESYFNRFIYDMDLHAVYATLTLNAGRFGIMGGLRGEYWKVHTESYDYEQEHDATMRADAFDKDYFRLFPSLFLSYQITKDDQLQLNYTRRLRRPWGGQLNSFRDTRDASMVSYGNPELTPEYSNSFSLNYLRTWADHSILVSAYYRPTTDVIQRIKYQSDDDGLIYSTNMNVSRSLSSGFELVVKNKLFRILDLTTTANAYYYKLDGFSFDIDGQTVTGESSHSFTWNARMTASLMLPYDISVQLSGRYNARRVITQGYRRPNYSIDLGARKNFFNKLFTVAVNCRDLLNSRKFENYTAGDTFTRYEMNKRGGRNIRLTVTWNFGNTKTKKRQQDNNDVSDPSDTYNGTEEM